MNKKNYKSDSGPVSTTCSELPAEDQLVTAAAWAILDYAAEQFIDSKAADQQMEIASLTKVATFYACWKIIQRFRLKYTLLRVSVTRGAVDTVGTSAKLVYGRWVTVEDLLYGLMLPSGNDSAVLLSQTFGLLIDFQRKNGRSPDRVKELALAQSIDMAFFQKDNSVVSLTQLFVDYMNQLVADLGLRDTCFTNPTGLSDPFNCSTAGDLCLLCAHVYRTIKIFPTIVSTKRRTAKFYERDGSTWPEDRFKECVWRNTNRLLETGYRGIKTGITKTAGGCLASFFVGEQGEFVIVVLGSSYNQNQRFADTQKLRQFYLQY